MINTIVTNLKNLISGVSGITNVVVGMSPTSTLSNFISQFPLDSSKRINVWFIERQRVSLERESAVSPRVFYNHVIVIDGFISGITSDDFNTLVDSILNTIVTNISLSGNTSQFVVMPPEASIDLAMIADRLAYHANIRIPVREVVMVTYT